MLKHQLKRLSPPSTQSGFTIIEGLLAILIVTALLVGIAPVITLSVATRLQARRVEQATQAARTYIDGVRSGKVATPERVIVLDEVDDPLGNKTFNPKRGLFSGTAAPPQGITITDINCRSTRQAFPYCINQPRLSLYCADFDGDGACSNRSTTDLIVQAFRSRTTDPTDDGSKGYLLGVRVYRAAAFNGNTDFQTTQEVGRKVRTNTGGTGEYRAPLVEMTTEVQARPDPEAPPEKQYKDFCDRLGGCQ
ncbi:MAG: hormogonium polysaccharide secretion pseudopilin HpsB [Symplocastrum torsivum CPER-KK1]|jgi:type II secretory pathway pseudopilin PulG|uniref:Hormogonium polysaccharide secretion pseudopilin HpsB n=1 Tax=Symplocastrum torsivum CPER-KK1 TaxID=450513 RepID=A0A951U7T7_9CYAN|nr:hormogonium polysaccharide secretion pseudopilin HpsB [Symplocastrum torsivum CPER-KK1]